MLTHVSLDSLSRLPIFPLPQTVFFPHTLLPLHIFEPRYRKMTADVLANDLPMAIAQLTGDGSDSFGVPNVHPVAGLGRILEHRRLPDGRYYLLLQGLARVRIEEELDTPEPYRIVRAGLLEDEYPLDPHSLVVARATLQSFVLGLSRTQPRIASALAEILKATDEPSVIADVIASLLITDAEERQRLLETPRVDLRLEAVTGVIAELVSVPAEDEEGHLVTN
jgi:hypothetical protein